MALETEKQKIEINFLNQDLLTKYPSFELEELSRILKARKDQVNITVEYTNKCPVTPKFYYYLSKLSFNESVISIGTGESFNKKLARMRAIGESLERLPLLLKTDKWEPLLYKNKFNGPIFTTSNGMAYNLDLISAIINAYRELVERHVVLNAWINYSPVQYITPWFSYGILNKLNGWKERVKANYIYFPNKYGLHVVANILTSKIPPYTLFGYGCDFDLVSAVEKAFMESWRFYWNYLINPIDNKFAKNEVQTFIDHYKYFATNSINLSKIFNIKQATSSKYTFNKRLTLDQKTFNSLVDEIYLFNFESIGLVGYSAKCSSSSLTQLWKGQLQKSDGVRKIGDIHPIP